MLVDAICYDEDLKGLSSIFTKKQTFKRACYFEDENGNFLTVLSHPNQIVPYGVIVNKKNFQSIKNCGKIRPVISCGKGISLYINENKSRKNKKISKIVIDLWNKKISEKIRDRIEKAVKEKKYRNILGLGEGLTPSGDDFLVGFIAGNWPNVEKFRKIDLSKTTSLSSFFLKNALKGKFSSAILDFVKGNSLELLNFGETSGIAVAYGIVKAWRYCE